jgi:hypothetical protein
VPIFIFGTLNMAIWAMYNYLLNIWTMTVANALGIVFAMFLAIGYLYAKKTLGDSSILVKMVKNVDWLFF